MSSIKKNFIYKTLLTISNYLIAFITFPYISRILGVENVGLVNFVDNTINYFLLFATMGVNVLGTREIAGAGDDNLRRSQVFSNILGVNLLFTVLTLFVYVILVVSIPKLAAYKELFYVGAAKILFTAFLIEWFFTGIEDFKFITIRSLLIKTLYVICIFIFVKSPSQYKLYFYLTVALTVINSLINIIYSHKFVKISVKDLFNFRYLKQNVTIGIYGIMTSMYLTFNVMYLGLVSDNIQVGYYTTAFKVYSVVLGFFSAFTNVMLPRMSAIISSDDKNLFNTMIIKSLDIMIMFSIPLILCTEVMAPEIIYVLSGPGYEGAIGPMRIIMPAIFSVGIAQVLAIQYLMPLKKDKVLLYVSIIGAIIALIVNIISVNQYKSIGSASVLLISESIVTLLYVAYIYHKDSIRINYKKLLRSVACSIPSVLICSIVSNHIENTYISLALAIILSVIVWYIIRYKELKSIRL